MPCNVMCDVLDVVDGAGAGGGEDGSVEDGKRRALVVESVPARAVDLRLRSPPPLL
jgi:hypothetical protein